MKQPSDPTTVDWHCKNKRKSHNDITGKVEKTNNRYFQSVLEYVRGNLFCSSFIVLEIWFMKNDSIKRRFIKSISSSKNLELRH